MLRLKKLYWRILGNFALLLLVLSAMTLLTLSILKQMEGHFNLASKDIRGLANLEQVRIYLSDVPNAADEYLFTGSPEAKLVYENGWKDFDVQINLLRRQVQDSSEQHALTQLRQLFYAWLENIGDKKIMLRGSALKPGELEQQLANLAQIESKIQYLSTARSVMRSMYQHVIATQPVRIQLAAGLTNELRQFVSLVNILLALFALALGFVLTRSITKPVEQLRKGTRGIMEGQFSPIEVNRTDEFGELASDFNQMSAMLDNNYGRLKAYSELVTALNTHDSLIDVESKSLTLLCQHAHAAVGALYLNDHVMNRLELAAGYALDSQGTVARTYQLGEGIPGQCAALGEPIEVHDMAYTKEFVVDTGLVRIPPAHLMATPIMFQDELIGVMVLGSPEPFNELRKEIIANSVPQIGVAITNARNFDATQKLSNEIAQKNEELNIKNAELQKAYRVKSDFLAGMSHELRTPLNSIIGFSSVLLDDKEDPISSDQRMALEKVLKNAKHLLQLINDILDFSKIEAGRMAINVEQEDVPSVIGGALMTVETLIRSKNLTMKQHVEPDLPKLNTDILKIKQILVNLLSNATKFTDQGEIVISASMQDGMIAIGVKDSGIGIAEKDLERVFEEFQQIESVSTKKYKGTGLGLPISRRLARMLGGDLTVKSEIGKGSTFTLTIPPIIPKEKLQDQPKPMPALPAKEPAAPQRAPVSAPTMPQGGTRVLCIDDDPDVIEILRKYLLPEGYSVTGAMSGDEGIRLAEQMRPSLITLDIMMPEKDGWQVLRELKQKDATKDIPVLIHSVIDNKPLAVHLGAIDVVTKPVESKRLIKLVNDVCKSKAQYVLVVDDDEAYCVIMKELLRQDGYNVRIANNGTTALATIAESKPALVVLDLNMPDMDGMEIVQRLQEREAWRDIPIVILSGRELTEDDKTKLNNHILEYIQKGTFSNESLSNTIRRILLQTPIAQH